MKDQVNNFEKIDGFPFMVGLKSTGRTFDYDWNEMKEWCNETVGRNNWAFVHLGSYYEYCFYFKDNNIAVLFKTIFGQ